MPGSGLQALTRGHIPRNPVPEGNPSGLPIVGGVQQRTLVSAGAHMPGSGLQARRL
jgi:hypothetical protein